MSIQQMRTAFNTFIDDNGHKMGDGLDGLWKQFRNIPDDQFIAGISFYIFGHYHLKGREGIKFIVDETAKKHDGKTLAEICPEAEVRDKFLLFLEFFCEKIGERSDVRDAVSKLNKNEDKNSTLI